MLSTYQLNIIYVYFTPLPLLLYNQSAIYGNFAYRGVGLGLIHSQIIFWTANLLLGLCLFLKNNINFFIFLVCIYLYRLSFLQFNYLNQFLRR